MKLTTTPLKDKIAIITGAGRGIGRATAVLFATAGADVAIVDLDSAEIEKAIEEVKPTKRRVIGIKTDVSKKDEVEAMVAKVLETFGTIDILVNNAGIVYFVPTMLLREEAWDKTFDVNVKGYYLCAQAAGKTMIKNNSGNIINFASMSGIIADRYSGAYCASKAAVMQFSRSLAGELANHHIRVNSIAPGIINTRLAAGAQRDEETKKRYNNIIPMGRFGEPEELASAALFLASDASSYITGTTLIVDGGNSISGMNPDERGKTMPDKYKNY